MNPLYNDIRCKAKFVITSILQKKNQKKNQLIVNFFTDIPILFFKENIRFVHLLESPCQGDSNKYTKRMIYKKKCSKVSVIDALDGSCQVSL